MHEIIGVFRSHGVVEIVQVLRVVSIVEAEIVVALSGNVRDLPGV